MIVKCKHTVIKRIIGDRRRKGAHPNFIKYEETMLKRTLSFGRIGKFCMGRGGIILVNFAIALTQFGYCVGYVIFLGTTLKGLLSHVLEQIHHDKPNLHTWMNYTNESITQTEEKYDPFSIAELKGDGLLTFIVMISFPLVPVMVLCLVRKIRKLGPLSALANGVLLAAYLSVEIYMIICK